MIFDYMVIHLGVALRNLSYDSGLKNSDRFHHPTNYRI